MHKESFAMNDWLSVFGNLGQVSSRCIRKMLVNRKLSKKKNKQGKYKLLIQITNFGKSEKYFTLLIVWRCVEVSKANKSFSLRKKKANFNINLVSKKANVSPNRRWEFNPNHWSFDCLKSAGYQHLGLVFSSKFGCYSNRVSLFCST